MSEELFLRLTIDERRRTQGLIRKIYEHIHSQSNDWIEAVEELHGMIQRVRPVKGGDSMGKYESRTQTNSITHLVKIVAREIVKEECEAQFDNIKHRLTTLEMASGEPATKVIDAIVALKKVRNSLSQAGGPWSTQEHALLVREVKTAIEQIAANHERTSGAIKARMRQKDLLTQIDFRE